LSQYAYCTTNILSGELLGTSLPMQVQNCGRTISMAGSLSGSLELGAQVSTQTLNTWIGAVEPFKSILWVLQDQQPIWHGPITGQPHESVTSGDLPVSASTMEAIFQFRQISRTLTFANMDVFDIIRGLISYAVNKSPNAAIAGLNLGTGESGIIDSITFDGSQLQKVYDALTFMVTEYPIEYAIRPALAEDGETLCMYLDLGCPSIGRSLAESDLQVTFPGNGVLDYAYPRVAQAGPANVVVASASTDTDTLLSQAPAGVIQAELDEGYPLLEDSISLTGLSQVSQAVVNATATAQATLESVTAMATPVIKLGAEAYPKANQILLGDWAEFAATSPLHPAGPGGVPGLMINARILSWSLYPPIDGQQYESTWLTLGEIEQAA
jgi:hypothetical protein